MEKLRIFYVVRIGEFGVEFKAVQLMEETEKEYKFLDKIGVQGYTKTFPKEKLNKEFQDGYVTSILDVEIIKTQILRIYNNINLEHIKSFNTSIEYNKGALGKSLSLLDTVAEYNK